MELHLEDARPETPSIDRAISRREGVLLSLVAHVLVILALLFVPEIPWVKAMLEAQRTEQQRQAELMQAQQPRNTPQFVYVETLRDVPSRRPPPRAELSDQDRQSQSVRPAPNPRNSLPFSLGNTPNRVEQQKPSPKPRGEGPAPETAIARQGNSPAEAAQPQTPQNTPQPSNMPPLPQGNTGQAYSSPSRTPTPAPTAPSSAGGGALGEALKNLQRYTEDQNFNNPDGNSGQFGPSIQFDTKGVEFGPWIRRFIAQVKRNWFVPMAAMSLKGHVVLTFNVHKSGAITDLTVLQPSSVEAFTNAAVNAIRGSSPTQILPPEYPSDKAFFTVTFYYNESPAP